MGNLWVGKMKITDLLDLRHLNDLVSRGSVTMRKHPHLPLFIYNAVDQVDCPNITRRCRGLVVDFEGNLVANCPVDENITIEDDKYVSVSEYKGALVLASRGDFEGPTVARARKIFHSNKAYQLALFSLCVEATAIFSLEDNGLRFLGTVANFETTARQLWTPANMLFWPGQTEEPMLR